jgi:hypothetical protein
MRTSAEYDLVEARSCGELVDAVNRRLADGWEPLGGPVARAGELFQAMLRSSGRKRIRKTSED